MIFLDFISFILSNVLMATQKFECNPVNALFVADTKVKGKLSDVKSLKFDDGYHFLLFF